MTVYLRLVLFFLFVKRTVVQFYLTYAVRQSSYATDQGRLGFQSMKVTQPVDQVRPTAPSEWTAFRSSSLPDVKAVWSSSDLPDELAILPETLRIPPKLAQIVSWSLQRPSTNPNVASSTIAPANGIQSNLHPDVCRQEPPEEHAETSSVVSEGHSIGASTLGRAIPKLRGTRYDLVGTAVSKIAALREKHAKDRAASKALTASMQLPQQIETSECTSCFEDFPLSKLINLPCTHNYCKPCLSTLITTALQSESTFPPKCCLSEIPVATILTPLDKKQRELYKEKAAEYSIPASRRW